MRNGNLLGFWTHGCTEGLIWTVSSKFFRALEPSKISLYSRKRLLSLYAKSELANAEIRLDLVGWRTVKTQSNSDVDLPRIHDVAASMTWNVVKVLLLVQLEQMSTTYFPSIGKGVLQLYGQTLTQGLSRVSDIKICNFSNVSRLIILTELPLSIRNSTGRALFNVNVVFANGLLIVKQYSSSEGFSFRNELTGKFWGFDLQTAAKCPTFPHFWQAFPFAILHLLARWVELPQRKQHLLLVLLSALPYKPPFRLAA